MGRRSKRDDAHPNSKRIREACLISSYGVTILSVSYSVTRRRTSAEKQRRYRERRLGVHGSASKSVKLALSSVTV
jgi:hypothetical protein